MDEKKFSALTKPQQDVVIKIAAEAERQGVNPAFAVAIAEAETAGKFNHFSGDKVTTSPSGARGLMQIMPDTARLYNKNLGADIDPDDEDSNIKGGVFILKDLLTKYKSPRNAVNLYNASPKANATFLKLYETDPDAAIMSLPKETRNYALRVSQNFDLDNDAETGLIGATKTPSRFANYESEAAKLKIEQEAQALRQAEADKNKPPAPPKTLLEKAKDFANDIQPAEAALTGAAINLAGPMFAKPVLSSAQEANLSAQDKLELARRNLENASAHRPGDLEDAYRESQDVLESLKNEQRLAQERLRGVPRAAPVIEPPAPSSPFPQVIREGRASGPKVEGDSGTRNWMIQEAGQKHQLPEAILDLATGKSKDSPTGGKALIDQDLANIEKIKRLGAGDFGLVTTEGGVQLQLPPTTVAERQADIDRQAQASQAELQNRTEQGRIQQEAQAQQLEQQRLAYEADLERIRQERAQAGQRHNVLAEQRRTTAPLQRAVTQAETNAELARRKLRRAPEPTTPAGKFTANTGRIVGRAGLGALAGAVGVMSYQEAMERFKAGDTSEGVLKALQAGSAGAMLVPPVGKPLRAVRRAGFAGLVGLGGRDFYNRLTKEPVE